MEKWYSELEVELLRPLSTVVTDEKVEFHGEREGATYKDSDNQVNECKRYKFLGVYVYLI